MIAGVGPDSLMTFWQQIWLILAGGALGGLSELLTELRFGANGITKSGPIAPGVFLYRECRIDLLALCLILFQSIPIGVCGAVAIEFALILLGSTKTGSAPQDLLFLLSMSAAAGFGARRLLPKLTSQLESKVISIEQVNKEQNVEIAELKIQQIAIEQAKEEAEESMLFQRVSDAQDVNALPSTKLSCITDLINCLSKVPHARRYAFRLGRLYKIDSKYKEALATMDDFLKNISNIPGRTVDVADANYNKACYATLLWESGDATFQDLAFSALHLSFQNAINKEDAKTEKDLAYLRSNAPERFDPMIRD